MDMDMIKAYVDNFCKCLNLTDYLGIIVYGSYVGGRSNDLSDLDIMIIMDNYCTMDCGSIMIDGLRIEYFIQDINRLYELVRLQIDDNDPSHLTKFATCKILYDTDNKVSDFINYACGLYNTKITHEFSDLDRFSIFGINNRIEDLEALINSDSFYATYYVVLEKIRSLYISINGIIDLPLMKIERLYTDREYASKYIASDIYNLPDPDFINLYLECLKIDDRITMLERIRELYTYSFKNLDFDANNFHLKFTKNAPFKV